MLAHLLAEYIQEPSDQIAHLLSMSPHEIYDMPYYQQLIDNLDGQALDASLSQAREAYKQGLPDFMAKFADRYDFASSPMSPSTLANWLVGFLKFSDYMYQLPDKHGQIPLELLQEALPDLLEMLDTMPSNSHQWQQAMAILSLPLVATG